MFEKCGVDVVLAGHLHMGYSGDVRAHHEATKRSILSIQAGTATSTRQRGGEPNAYNWITLHGPNRLQLEVRSWTGDAFSSAEQRSFERANAVWVAS
jgi:3',5'-cyclic AMP phosphodiesterase CpdA